MAAERTPLKDLKGARMCKVVARLYRFGPGRLIRRGYTGEELETFANRPDVKREFDLLRQEYDEHEQSMDRTRFSAQAKLASLADEALEVMRMSLCGPTYDIRRSKKTGKTAVHVIVPAPTRNMLKTALEVLDRLGVIPEIELQAQIDTAKKSISNAAGVRIIEQSRGLIGETEGDKAYSREKVRAALAGAVMRLTHGEGTPEKSSASKKAG